MDSYIPISYGQLALASALILINIVLSFILRLGLDIAWHRFGEIFGSN